MMERYYNRRRTLREAHLTASIKLRCGDESYRDLCDWTERFYRELTAKKDTPTDTDTASESTKKPATDATVTSFVPAI